jgi:RND family efflux transporter MFP subunit
MDNSGTESSARLITPGRLKVAAIIVLVVAVLLVVSGVVSRRMDGAAVAQWTSVQAVPTVTVVQPSTTGVGGAVVLPGRVEAWYQAPIYARVSGYLKAWYTDIGAQVKAGQLLAEIETPDLDQQLEQAKAELATTHANEALAAVTSQRWQLMLQADSVSKQAAEEKSGDLDAKQAVRKAAEANVQRLEALEGFKRIVAPFDGMVTARLTDVGALINAGSGVGPQLFTVSDVHSLRVYVSVPQDEAAPVRAGMTAKLKVPEHPDRSFTAVITSTAGAVDAASGTVLVELKLDDAGGDVLPGDYADVEMDLPAAASVVRIPATALIFKSSGLQIATVNANDRIGLRTVTIKEDLGTSVEVSSGLSTSDRVVDNPSESLQDGDEVQISTAGETAPVKPVPAPKTGQDPSHAAGN